MIELEPSYTGADVFPPTNWEDDPNRSIVIHDSETMNFGGTVPKTFSIVSANTPAKIAENLNFLMAQKALQCWSTIVDYDTSGGGGAYREWGAQSDISHVYSLPLDTGLVTDYQPEIDILIPRIHPRVEWLGCLFRYQLPDGYSGLDVVSVDVSLTDITGDTVYDVAAQYIGETADGDPRYFLDKTESSYFSTKGTGLGIDWNGTPFPVSNVWTKGEPGPPRYIYVSSEARAAGGPYLVRLTRSSWVRIIAAYVLEIPEMGSDFTGPIPETYTRRTTEIFPE